MKVGLNIKQQLERFDIDTAKDEIIKTLGTKITDEFAQFPGLLKRVQEELEERGIIRNA